MFRENLKAQIEYKGLIIKELAEKSGISKKTIDSYVGASACMPAADVAVRLARALGTTVEYLVDGEYAEQPSESDSYKEQAALKTYRSFLLRFASLCERDRQIVCSLVSAMAQQNGKDYPPPPPDAKNVIMR